VNKSLIAIGVLVAAVFGGYQWLSNVTIDVNPASIAKNMTYEEKVKMCDALTQEGSDLDGYTAFDMCMEGMNLASQGIQNPVIPDLAQPPYTDNTTSGYSDNESIAPDMGDAQNDSVNSGESNDQNEAVVSGESVATTSFVQGLSSWSSSGFQSMMDNSYTDSPAWKYAYHLFNGRLSQRQAGGSDGSPLKMTSEGTGYRVCFTSSCEMLFDRFQTQSGMLYSFSVNGVDLSNAIVANSDDSSYVCGSSGACASLRSLSWFGGTAYATIEVKVNNSSAGKAVKAAVRLITTSGQNLSLTSGTTPHATINTNAHYSVGFKNSTSPWGGEVRVKLKTSLGTDTLILPVS
jgi:hypothetical protein